MFAAACCLALAQFPPPRLVHTPPAPLRAPAALVRTSAPASLPTRELASPQVARPVAPAPAGAVPRPVPAYATLVTYQPAPTATPYALASPYAGASCAGGSCGSAGVARARLFRRR